MTVKAVIFDLGNVLVNYDARGGARRFAEECGIPVMKMWTAFFISDVEKQYTMGKVSTADFFEFARKSLRIKTDFETFRFFWNDIFEENPGMEEILGRLHGRYPLYLLSNTNEMHFDHIRENYAHLLKYFKDTFPSHELGCRKPDREIYVKVLKRMGLKAEETVFFDDMPAFVAGARKVGIQAFKFTTKRQLLKDLKKIGIEL